MVNSRNTTPNSASAWTVATSGSTLSANGPKAAPTARYPITGLVFSRRSSGTTIATAARKTSTSLKCSESDPCVTASAPFDEGPAL